MASTMTKSALVRHMAEKFELSNKQAGAFLDYLAETAIKETVESSEISGRRSALAPEWIAKAATAKLGANAEAGSRSGGGSAISGRPCNRAIGTAPRRASGERFGIASMKRCAPIRATVRWISSPTTFQASNSTIRVFPGCSRRRPPLARGDSVRG